MTTVDGRGQVAASRSAIRPRRAYADWRGGQVHFREMRPARCGSNRPVVCIHQAFHSGNVFGRFMEALGVDRIAIAPDLPGHGESDATPSRPQIADYAAAVVATMDEARLSQVDLVGYHLGSTVAIDLAARCPERVGRVVLIGIPCFLEAEREAAAQMLAARRTEPAEDGSHLLAEWSRSVAWRGAGMSLDSIARNFVDKLKTGPRLNWGAEAALHYPLLETLGAVSAPVVVIRARDDLWEATPRALGVIRRLVSSADIDDFGFGMFDVVPDRLAALVTAGLDAPTDPAVQDAGAGV